MIGEPRPSGELKLQIRDHGNRERRKWADARTQRVEDCLAGFIRGLRLTAPVLRERRLEREEREREYEERRSRYEQEQKRVSDLAKWADQWHEARRLRMFVVAARRELQRRHGGELPQDWEEWLVWADSYVDRQDPLALSED